MNMIDWTKEELKRIGMSYDSTDEVNVVMYNHIIHMIKEFCKQGHSGLSANYAVNLLNQLLRYEPLTPLTGEEDEWIDRSEMSGEYLLQNKRCSRVFKNKERSYDVEGKIFFEWIVPEDGGEPYKSHFTDKNSLVTVTFPYTPKTEYVEVKN